MAQKLVVAYRDGHDGVQYLTAGTKFYVDDDKLHKDGEKKGLPIDGSDWYGTPESAPEVEPEAKSDRPPGAGPAKGSKAK